MFRKQFPFRAAVIVALLCSASRAVAASEQTKDDVDFRKKNYVNKKGDKMPYRLFVPPGYDSAKSYPLILWLHGGEGRGSDNLKQITRGNEKGTHLWIASDVQAKFPVFVLAPQCPTDGGWAEPELNRPGKPLELAMDILSQVQREFAIDPNRLYLVGQSMGGLGVWSALQMYPGKWAGAIILAAYDNFTNIAGISRVPLWVFQGDADPSVPVEMVREMMKQLKKAEANLRYSEYHNVDHQVWNKAFQEPELIPWLSAQRRGHEP
jgi:predicted peptidase